MADEKKVSLAEVVQVLAKHANTPNDPDDAATLTRWNEQQASTTTEAESSPGKKA
jgi:hypothetical protein